MRITAGIGASACLALALAGCANNCGLESVDYAPAPQVVMRTVTMPTATAGCPVVAVMPFIGVNDAPASGILVADALCRQLTDCSDCVVVSPETVTAKAGVKTGDTWDPVETGRRVGAPYVVTGRVTDYAVGDGDDGQPMVGLAVRLLETKTGRVIWTGDGSKSAAELPDGGLDALAFAACDGIAKTIHDNLDKTATVTVAATNTAPRAPAETSETVASSSAKLIPALAAEAPTVVAEKKTEIPAVAEVKEVKETPKPHLGEGTADWAVPLEKMPQYLESIGSSAPALASGREISAPTDPSVEGVGSVLGMEKEEDMTGALLIPGAITIDLADDKTGPRTFGIQTEERDVAPITPDPIGEVRGGVVAESPTGSLRPAQTVSPQEAAKMLDLFEDLSTAPEGLGASPAPAKAPASVKTVPVASRETEPTVEPGSLTVEDADGGTGELSTQFTVDYSLELEGDDENFDDKFSVDSVDLDFFGSLSESLNKDLDS